MVCFCTGTPCFVNSMPVCMFSNTGAADVITDLPAAEETAAQYGVEPVVVPGVAHDFMLVRSLAVCRL